MLWSAGRDWERRDIILGTGAWHVCLVFAKNNKKLLHAVTLLLSLSHPEAKSASTKPVVAVWCLRRYSNVKDCCLNYCVKITCVASRIRTDLVMTNVFRGTTGACVGRSRALDAGGTRDCWTLYCVSLNAQSQW